MSTIVPSDELGAVQAAAQEQRQADVDGPLTPEEERIEEEAKAERNRMRAWCRGLMQVDPELWNDFREDSIPRLDRRRVNDPNERTMTLQDRMLWSAAQFALIEIIEKSAREEME